LSMMTMALLSKRRYEAVNCCGCLLVRDNAPRLRLLTVVPWGGFFDVGFFCDVADAGVTLVRAEQRGGSAAWRRVLSATVEKRAICNINVMR